VIRHSIQTRKTDLWIPALLILGLALTGFSRESPKETIAFDATHWNLNPGANITEFGGRKALAGIGYLKNVEFLNGTVEVDLFSTGEINFGGFIFRVQSIEEYEWCWLRMHKTNGLIQDGVQYAPVFNGQGCWQLNGGKGGIAPVDCPKNEWVHLKLEILNESAKLYVKDMTTPVLVMDRLQLGLKKGSIGVSSLYPKNLYFSNFSYQLNSEPVSPAPEEPIPSNILTDWRLSPSYKVKDFEAIVSYPEAQMAEMKDWIVPEVDSTGLVNISRYFVHHGQQPDCAILKTTLHWEQDRLVKMNFGYSDAAAIFLNQQPVFWGNSAYRSRNLAYGGWISYNDAVFLNLKKGHNELVVVVAEVFGGWGFQAKIEEFPQ